jgi:hypothetical protein
VLKITIDYDLEKLSKLASYIVEHNVISDDAVSSKVLAEILSNIVYENGYLKIPIIKYVTIHRTEALVKWLIDNYYDFIDMEDTSNGQ